MPLPIRVSSLCRLCSRFLVGSDARAAARRRSSSCWISVGIFEQSDHLGPDDLIEQILPHEAARCRIPGRPVFASCPSQCICSSGSCARSYCVDVREKA